MESKPQTQSVIAKLMGLDDMPLQQPIYTRKRVLSENYLQKTASIGLREKRPIKELGHTFSRNTGKKQQPTEMFRMPGVLKAEKEIFFTDEANMAFVSKRFEDAKRFAVNGNLQQSKEFNGVLEDLNSKKEDLLRYLLQRNNSLTKSDLWSSNVSNYNRKLSKIEKTTARRIILRSLQKLENGFATEPYGNICMPTKIVILKPNSGKEKSYRSSLSCSSQSGESKQEYSSPINEELHTKVREGRTRNGAFKSSRHGYRLSKGCLKEKEVITLNKRHKFSIPSSNASSSEVGVDETSVNEPEIRIFSNGSAFASEAKQRLTERWKMIKVSQKVETGSCGFTLGEMLSVPELVASPKTLNDKVDLHDSRSHCILETGNLEAGSPVCICSNESNLDENFMPGNYGHDSFIPNASAPAFAYSVIDEMADAETENVGLASGDCTVQQSLPMGSDMFVKDGHFSPFSDTSAGQELQIGSHEYVIDSNCMSSGEAYQPSPNSVLEPPFKEDDSPPSHHFETVSTDLQGLWIQLQLLKSKSEETPSEGTGMVVSSDEDTTEKSFGSNNGKNVKLMEFLREEESRDFSYLLDVFEELGLHGGTMLLSFDRWHSPECLIGPSVFEALEKKYSEHANWNKTERRLLFDRINAGLLEILKPWLDVHVDAKLLRKKVSNALRRDVIEEELWTLLVSDEREVRKELSEKALGKESWLELSDDIETIAIDIEKFLFDELAAELVNT